MSRGIKCPSMIKDPELSSSSNTWPVAKMCPEHWNAGVGSVISYHSYVSKSCSKVYIKSRYDRKYVGNLDPSNKGVQMEGYSHSRGLIYAGAGVNGCSKAGSRPDCKPTRNTEPI